MTVSTNAARNLFDQLRALEKPKDGHRKIPVPLVDWLERRLLAALERDRTGAHVIDGWPTSTTGNGTSGPPTSSVEAAVVALVDHNPPRDYHRELTRRAAQALDNAVVALNTLRSALSSIDDLAGLTTPSAEGLTCSHCTGKRGPGNDHPVHATGTVGDRLERSIALCEDCYGYVKQTTTAGTRGGWLPTDEEIARHEERGRWRIHRPELPTANQR